MSSRRSFLKRLLALGITYPLVACGEDHKNGGSMKSTVILSVVIFNYLNRSIFDVLINGIDVGVARGYGGGGGIMTGVGVPLGIQTVTWRLGGPEGMPGNGDTVKAKNVIELTGEQVGANGKFLGVHIYPDETAEFLVSSDLPYPSPRGEQIYKEKHLYGR